MRILGRICAVLCLIGLSVSGLAERFQNPAFLKTNGPFYQLLAADLTHSGRQDLIYWSQGGNQAWYEVIRNDGQRKFTDLGQVALPSVGISAALTGDFNEDGKADLVFLAWYQGAGYDVWFLAGKGDGTFAAPITSSISSFAFPNYQSLLALFAGHLNTGGHLDLTVSSPWSGATGIDVLRGDGNGRFALQTSISSPATLEGVLDVNGDGLADLAVWNYANGGESASNSIQIFLNRGNGTYAPIQAFKLPPLNGFVTGLRSAVFADLDGDGIPDLVCHDGYYVYTATGKGDGTFKFQTKKPFESQGFLLTPTDMDGDGKPDLLFREDWGVTVMLQQDGFTYKQLDQGLWGYLQRLPLVTDLDGDGKPDVMVPNSLPDNTTFGVSILWGLGGGKLDSATGYREQYYLTGGAIGQFTLAGAPDIAVQGSRAAKPLTLKNRGDGTFRWLSDPNGYHPPNYMPSPNLYEYELQTGDFNGDGKPDLLESGYQSTLVGGDYNASYQAQTLAGRGNGGFGMPGALPGASTTIRVHAISAGDLNGDGLTDIAESSDAGQIEILLAQKDGSWKLTQTFANSSFTNLTQAVFGDWNGDGIPDMAILSPSQDHYELEIYLGNGDGTFQNGQVLQMPSVNQYWPGIAGDVDGDGNLDLLFSSTTSLYPVYGKGDGTFAVGRVIDMTGQAGVYITASLVADVNRDGIPDLVISAAEGLIVRHGKGNRTWDAGDVYIDGGAGANARAIWLEDLNQDGFPDIAMVEDNSYAVGVLLNIPGSEDVLATLTVSPEPQQEGAGATLHLTLTPAVSGKPAPEGTVEVTVDGAPAGTGTLAGGQLDMPLNGADKLLPGRHWVVVRYPGNSLYHAVRASTAHVVLGPAQAATTTTLQGQPATIAVGGVFALTATVSGASGGTPTGTVTFLSGTASIGTATLNGGKATLAWTPAVGTFSVTAVYAGDSNFKGSTSEAVSLSAVSPNIYTYAGTGKRGYSGDGGPAIYAELDGPWGIVIDAQGNLYIADGVNNDVRKVDKAGVITTVAGNQTAGFSGDNGPATSAQLNGPLSLAVDRGGNLYIADSQNNRIRRVDAQTGIITTVAGNGKKAFSGDGGPATQASLAIPSGLAVDAAGNIYIGDGDSNRVRKVDGKTGVINTFAGTGGWGYTGDSGPAIDATFKGPWTLSLDDAGNLYITDWNNWVIRRVDAGTGIITTVAGDGIGGYTGDGGPAIDATFNEPLGTALDPSGDLFVADPSTNVVREVNATTGIIVRVAGNGGYGYGGDGGPATEATLGGPEFVTLDAAGNLYIADTENARVRVVGAAPPPSLIPTTTTLATSATTLNAGQTVTLTATVTTANGSTPAGMVTFLNGTTSVGSATLDSGGLAKLVLTPGVGTMSLTASYGGSSNDASSVSSPPLLVTVSAAATSTTLTASSTALSFGQNLTLTAKVAAAEGGIPAGSVTFWSGAKSSGTVNLDASGRASLVITPDPGVYSLSASYGGSTNDDPSKSAAIQVTVTALATTTALTASPNPAPFGTSVTFRAKVSSDSLAPTGMVSFYDGAALLGTSSLSGGAASYSTAALSVGTHTVKASYAGATGFAPGESPAVKEVISPADFSVSAAPAKRTLYTGESTWYTVTVHPGDGFSLPVVLSCSQVPAGTTCVFSPATIGAGATTAKVKVQTSAPTRPTNASLRGTMGAAALAGLLLWWMPRNLRRRLWLLVLLALGTTVAGLGGCSGPTVLTGGTPVGTQTIVITGTSGNGAQTLSHTTTVTLQVKSLF